MSLSSPPAEFFSISLDSLDAPRSPFPFFTQDAAFGLDFLDATRSVSAAFLIRPNRLHSLPKRIALRKLIHHGFHCSQRLTTLQPPEESRLALPAIPGTPIRLSGPKVANQSLGGRGGRLPDFDPAYGAQDRNLASCRRPGEQFPDHCGRHNYAAGQFGQQVQTPELMEVLER